MIVENSRREEYKLKSGQKISLPIYINDPRIGIRIDDKCNYGDIVSIRNAALSGSLLNIPVKSSILEHGEQKKCFYVNISNSTIQE